jgi:hypothetical protein
MHEGRRRAVLAGLHEAEPRLAIRQPRFVRLTRVRRFSWLCRSNRWRRLWLRDGPDGGTINRRTVSAKLFFDPDGRITNFFARRYQDIGTDSEPTLWSTPITAYRTFCGLRLPAAGQAVWHLESGDFTYMDLRVDEITYDSDGS